LYPPDFGRQLKYLYYFYIGGSIEGDGAQAHSVVRNKAQATHRRTVRGNEEDDSSADRKRKP